MPGDVTGTNLFDFQSNRFHLRRGPVFTDVLVADEINRAPPKTQSALLEAMQERSVTLDGTTHALGEGFLVVATQNPIEQEGTYPLPEAQLDRFLFKVAVRYPSRDDERAMVERHGTRIATPRPEEHGVTPVADLARVLEARAVARATTLAGPVLDYVVDLVRATRGRATLLCGASPRGAIMLSAAARALAALRGRDFAIPDDVKDLAPAVLGHRVVLAPGAEIEGTTAEAVVREVLEQVPAPR
jgi:MoxR-like ATPase